MMPQIFSLLLITFKCWSDADSPNSFHYFTQTTCCYNIGGNLKEFTWMTFSDMWILFRFTTNFCIAIRNKGVGVLFACFPHFVYFPWKKYWKQIIMSDMLAAHCLMQPRTPFSCFTSTAHFCFWSPLSILDPTGLLQNNFPAGEFPLYTGVCDSSIPHARLFISSWWPSSAFHQPISPTFWCCSGAAAQPCEFSHFYGISRLAGSALCTIILLTNEHVEQDWTQHCPMHCSAGYWSPASLCATEHHPLGLAIQPVFSPVHCLPI